MTNTSFLRVFAVLSAINLLNVHRCNAENQGQQSEQVPLQRYMFAMCDQLDCYYTIEDYGQSATQSPKLSWAQLASKPAKNINALLTILKTQLPQADVYLDEKMPVIIRIKNKSLSKTPNYVFERKIDFNYNHVLGGIFVPLKKQYQLPFRWMRSLPIGQSFTDLTTKVKFSSKDEEVRQIMTRYLPLSRYKRLLWDSYTVVENGQPVTDLIHSGPIFSYKNLVYDAKETQLSFSQGIKAYAKNAYAKNLNTDQVVSEALSFIEEHMKTKDKLNVRWAMFYLGKHKVEKGIPTLLKYIDYQYTTSPLIDEAFPALKSLVQIGRPAADAALKNLATDKDPKRLRLLIRVVMGVNGLEEGNKIVTAALPNIKDAAQRKQVETALKTVVAQIPNDATATVPEPDDEQEVNYTPPA